MTVRVLGLLGGMSWVSTVRYYTELQRGATRRGAEHALPVAVWSMDFAAVLRAQARGDTAAERTALIDGAARLRAAGAERLLICSTTMHRFAGDVADAAGLPVDHIGDAVASVLRGTQPDRVGLLATATTTASGGYAEYLRAAAGVEVLTPDADDVRALDALIRTEEGAGRTSPSGAAQLESIARRLVARGAQVLVQGCTSLDPRHLREAGVPVVDAVAAHVEHALTVVTTGTAVANIDPADA